MLPNFVKWRQPILSLVTNLSYRNNAISTHATYDLLSQARLA